MGSAMLNEVMNEKYSEITKSFGDNKLHRINVFVIDDDEMCLKLVEHQLQTNFTNCTQIHKFQSAKTFIGQIEEQRPDVVVLDYFYEDQWGEFNGLTLLKRILDKHPDTEVLMMTGHKQMHLAVQSIRQGAKDFIVKGDKAMARLNENVLEILENYRDTCLKKTGLVDNIRKMFSIF